jgi:hypothetical protein
VCVIIVRLETPRKGGAAAPLYVGHFLPFRVVCCNRQPRSCVRMPVQNDTGAEMKVLFFVVIAAAIVDVTSSAFAQNAARAACMRQVGAHYDNTTRTMVLDNPTPANEAKVAACEQGKPVTANPAAKKN